MWTDVCGFHFNLYDYEWLYFTQVFWSTFVKNKNKQPFFPPIGQIFESIFGLSCAWILHEYHTVPVIISFKISLYNSFNSFIFFQEGFLDFLHLCMSFRIFSPISMRNPVGILLNPQNNLETWTSLKHWAFQFIKWQISPFMPPLISLNSVFYFSVRRLCISFTWFSCNTFYVALMVLFIASR